MIYMAGDNNLAVDMAYAMEQIKGITGEGANSLNLFVYYDGNSASIPTLYCDFSDPNSPKYARSYKVPNKLYQVSAKVNENATDTRSLKNFVDWCVNCVAVEDENGETSFGRRAKRYGLILSGHSLGFEDKGLFRDETSGKTMKIADLQEMLLRLVMTKDGLAKAAKAKGLKDDELERETTKLLGQKLDILGFDSCVMGMIEVGYQFQDVAKTMIASEGSVPSAGWTYAKILGGLARGEHHNKPVIKVAEDFVKEFIESQDQFTVGGVSVDMAAWDLSHISDLRLAFDGLGQALLQCFDKEESRIYRLMERIILQVHWKCQSYMYDQNVDLGDFCEMLRDECILANDEMKGDDLASLNKVRESCDQILKEVNKTVILSGFSGGEYQYSNGVSVFFPWSLEGYEGSRKNYESLSVSKDGGNLESWSGFLKTYLKKVARRKFVPPTTDYVPGTKYRYLSGIRFDDQSASYPMTKSQAASSGSVRQGDSGSSVRQGDSGSSVRQGDSGSSVRQGDSGSSVRQGGGSNVFYSNLKRFKNIESEWSISGFSRKPGIDEQEPKKQIRTKTTSSE